MTEWMCEGQAKTVISWDNLFTGVQYTKETCPYLVFWIYCLFIPLRKFGHPIHARLSTMDLSLIYKKDSRPSRILQCDWLRAAETIRQELELYHTWILDWVVKPHNKSTFRLVLEKWNDKMFKRNTFLGPVWSKYRQKEFSAKIRICHFLDGKIRQHWFHRTFCLRGPI